MQEVSENLGSHPFPEFQASWISVLFGNWGCDFFKDISTLKNVFIIITIIIFGFVFSFTFSLLCSSRAKQKDENCFCLVSGKYTSQGYSEYTFSITNTYSSTCIYKYANTDITICAFHRGVKLDLQHRKWSRNGFLIRIIIEDTSQPCKKKLYNMWFYSIRSCTIMVRC